MLAVKCPWYAVVSFALIPLALIVATSFYQHNHNRKVIIHLPPPPYLFIYNNNNNNNKKIYIYILEKINCATSVKITGKYILFYYYYYLFFCMFSSTLRVKVNLDYMATKELTPFYSRVCCNTGKLSKYSKIHTHIDRPLYTPISTIAE